MDLEKLQDGWLHVEQKSLLEGPVQRWPSY